MKISFCGRAEVEAKHRAGALADTWVISIQDPFASRPELTNCLGVHWAYFADAANGEPGAPGPDDLEALLEFGRKSSADEVIVQCLAGISRSPAVAWVLAYDQLHSGKPDLAAAQEAMKHILLNRPGAMPNAWVMLLGLVAVHQDFDSSLSLLRQFSSAPFMSENLWQRWHLIWAYRLPALAS